MCFDAGIFACLSRKLCVAHKQKRKPLAARCSGTLFGAADDDGSGGAGGGGAWRSMGIEVEPFARLPFFNAPHSLSVSTRRVLLPAHFVFRSEPEIIIATWRCPHQQQQQHSTVAAGSLARGH